MPRKLSYSVSVNNISTDYDFKIKSNCAKKLFFYLVLSGLSNSPKSGQCSLPIKVPGTHTNFPPSSSSCYPSNCRFEVMDEQIFLKY